MLPAICTWFSPAEITEIVAAAYLQNGAEEAPGPFSRVGASSCEGWVSDSDGGVLNLHPTRGPETAELSLRDEEFIQHPAISTEVRVGTLEAAVLGRPGTSAYLAVTGHPDVLAFMHVTPGQAANRPAEWHEHVGLTIADELLRRMSWLRALPTTTTPLPDVAGALPGDDEAGPRPVGTVTGPPNADRLDFLFELGAYRDAHWLDPQDPNLGSGGWTAGRPFHVREGFVNDGHEPLGSGFDVILYVTQVPDGATYRYTSDYVLKGMSDRCGPTYESQEGPETCEWFVHDFPDGLPEGRFAIWAMWEAPCRAWIEFGFASECRDPDEVISLFSSGFDAPFTQAEPRFTEPFR